MTGNNNTVYLLKEKIILPKTIWWWQVVMLKGKDHLTPSRAPLSFRIYFFLFLFMVVILQGMWLLILSMVAKAAGKLYCSAKDRQLEDEAKSLMSASKGYSNL